MASNLLKVVASSVSIANHAGHAIRSILKTGDLAIVDKAVKDEAFDPQTAADRAAQSIIVTSLSQQFPGIVVVGEEDDCEVANNNLIVQDFDNEVFQHECPDDFKDLDIADLVVWVDPLDGTKEFTEGHIEHVTVLIGISAHGKAIAGVIHQPFYKGTVGRTIWGVLGIGTFGISRQENITGRRIVTTTKSHMTQDVQDTIDAMKPDQVLRTGGCGYKVLQVIEGFADAYIFATPGTKKWDSCAPEAVLVSMGGNLTDICNEHINYGNTAKKFFMNWTGLLCTFSDHESYAANVPGNIKASLKERFIEKTK